MTDDGPSALAVVHVEPRQLHDLRRRVLRSDHPESSVDNPRDGESTTLHLGGYLGVRLVVCASFYPTVARVNEQLTSHQLRYMATEVDERGHGFAARVLRVAQDELMANGSQQLWANARDSALGFYRATGWSIVAGSEHLSAETKIPHTVIFKVLVPDLNQ